MASFQERMGRMTNQGLSAHSVQWVTVTADSAQSGVDGALHIQNERKIQSIEFILFNLEKLTLKRSNHYAIRPTPLFSCFFLLDSCLIGSVFPSLYFLQLQHFLSHFLGHNFLFSTLEAIQKSFGHLLKRRVKTFSHFLLYFWTHCGGGGLGGVIW